MRAINMTVILVLTTLLLTPRQSVEPSEKATRTLRTADGTITLKLNTDSGVPVWMGRRTTSIAGRYEFYYAFMDPSVYSEASLSTLFRYVSEKSHATPDVSVKVCTDWDGLQEILESVGGGTGSGGNHELEKQYQRATSPTEFVARY